MLYRDLFQFLGPAFTCLALAKRRRVRHTPCRAGHWNNRASTKSPDAGQGSTKLTLEFVVMTHKPPFSKVRVGPVGLSSRLCHATLLRFVPSAALWAGAWLSVWRYRNNPGSHTLWRRQAFTCSSRGTLRQ